MLKSYFDKVSMFVRSITAFKGELRFSATRNIRFSDGNLNVSLPMNLSQAFFLLHGGAL